MAITALVIGILTGLIKAALSTICNHREPANNQPDTSTLGDASLFRQLCSAVKSCNG